MELTAVVLYSGALAQYEVSMQEGGRCCAQLSSYKGNPSHLPPQKLELRKEGRHWVSNEADRNLSDEIGYAVEIKAKPLLDPRKRSGGNPAE